MMLYLIFGIDNMDCLIDFYDYVFGVIDGIREVILEIWVQYGCENEKGKVCLIFLYDGNFVMYGNGMMLVFNVKNYKLVDVFYVVVLVYGGLDEGKLGVCEGIYYVVYVCDFYGNKFCVFILKQNIDLKWILVGVK